MTGALAVSLSPAEVLTLALGAVLIVLVAVMAWRAWKSRRFGPEEVERRRRKALAAHGKMADARLLELRENLLLYSYDVRGVEYLASQDISALRHRLPAEPEAVAGIVSVKYDARNPANSIILSEEWSGIRNHRR